MMALLVQFSVEYSRTTWEKHFHFTVKEYRLRGKQLHTIRYLFRVSIRALKLEWKCTPNYLRFKKLIFWLILFRLLFPWQFWHTFRNSIQSRFHGKNQNRWYFSERYLWLSHFQNWLSVVFKKNLWLKG